ncbi:MAG: hypothetical protein AMXMBFR81_20120 [Chthonomonas sp.]
MAPITEGITFLPTADLEATHRFYSGVLGLDLVLDQGSCRIYRVVGTSYWGFCERAAPTAPEQVVLTVCSDDVDARHRRFESSGLPTDGPPRTHAAFGIYHFYARDPNGYRIEVQRFLDPGWAAGQR